MLFEKYDVKIKSNVEFYFSYNWQVLEKLKKRVLMESTDLSEAERAYDIYIVSTETSIDLKVEPVDEGDEDVVVEDDDTNSEQTDSVLSTTMYTYTQFNETGTFSGASNLAPAEPNMEANRTKTGFKLKFANESGIKTIKVESVNTYDGRIRTHH